jgi:hypothetical protein
MLIITYSAAKVSWRAVGTCAALDVNFAIVAAAIVVAEKKSQIWAGFWDSK